MWAQIIQIGRRSDLGPWSPRTHPIGKRQSRLLAWAILTATLAGCEVKNTSPATPAGGGQSLGGHIKRGMEKPKAQNVLDQLAKFYQLYNVEHGRSPASWAELKGYMSKDAGKLVQTIEEGRYEIIWNARLASNVVLAYEKEPDLRGNQVVALGDGHIESMTPDKLQAALQNK
jgi:hypothetical protein